MDIYALVLVSGLLHLCNLASCAPPWDQPNLKDIISEIETYNDTTSQFVEDVQVLVDNGCKDEFFCTVLDILKNNSNLEDKRNKQAQIIKRNLAVFIKTSKIKCGAKEKAKEKSPISALLRFLQDCSRKRNSL